MAATKRVHMIYQNQRNANKRGFLFINWIGNQLKKTKCCRCQIFHQFKIIIIMRECVCVCVYVCRAYTIPESFPMGLINSLHHHHHHHKGTLLVTVAEFYVHALAPIANFFMAFETSDCNDFFLFALQTRIRFSAMFVVNWHFLFLFFFSLQVKKLPFLRLELVKIIQKRILNSLSVAASK